MIFLITAVPGSGKSLTLVERIVEYVKEGRKVYTNLPLKWSEPSLDPDVEPHLLIDPSGKYVFPLPEHNDWQLLPQGSVVIYDEAQKIFPATAKAGIVNDDRLTGLETHRHYGYDIYFVTQDSTFVHHHIRKLVGAHIHLYRGSGASVVARYTWSHYVSDPNNREEQKRATLEMWKFPKHLFPFYHSSVEHTHKLKLPKKVLFLGCFILLLVGGFVYNVFYRGAGSLSPSEISPVVVSPASASLPSASSFASLPSASASPSVIPDLVSSSEEPFERVYLLSTAPEAVPLEGCISYKNNCQCFNKQGFVLELKPEQCRDILRKPLPRQLPVSSGGAPVRS